MSDTQRPRMLALGNHREMIWLEGKHPRKELLEHFGVKSCRKIYRDNPDGSCSHVGYLVSGIWFNLYTVTAWSKQP